MVTRFHMGTYPNANCSTKNSEASSSSNTVGNTHLRDASKPEGEACNADGTLKDASELEWPDSPSEPNAATFEIHPEDDNDRVWDYWNLKKSDAPMPSTVSK
jgi:hypothetical protein